MLSLARHAVHSVRGMATTTAGALGIDKLGIAFDGPVHRNLSYDEILEHEVANNEGVVASNGAFCCDTGKFTGRSPKDKYFVEQSPSKERLWWGEINQPCTGAVFDDLYGQVTAHYSNSADKMYVFDGYCGARAILGADGCGLRRHDSVAQSG